MVISRTAFTVLWESPSFAGFRTCMSLNSGTNWESGSVTLSLPSSTRIMAAIEVIGLDMEAMRKMVRSVSGTFSWISCMPTLAR